MVDTEPAHTASIRNRFYRNQFNKKAQYCQSHRQSSLICVDKTNAIKRNNKLQTNLANNNLQRPTNVSPLGKLSSTLINKKSAVLKDRKPQSSSLRLFSSKVSVVNSHYLPQFPHILPKESPRVLLKADCNHGDFVRLIPSKSDNKNEKSFPESKLASSSFSSASLDILNAANSRDKRSNIEKEESSHKKESCLKKETQDNVILQRVNASSLFSDDSVTVSLSDTIKRRYSKNTDYKNFNRKSNFIGEHKTKLYSFVNEPPSHSVNAIKTVTSKQIDSNRNLDKNSTEKEINNTKQINSPLAGQFSCDNQNQSNQFSEDIFLPDFRNKLTEAYLPFGTMGNKQSRSTQRGIKPPNKRTKMSALSSHRTRVPTELDKPSNRDAFSKDISSSSGLCNSWIKGKPSTSQSKWKPKFVTQNNEKNPPAVPVKRKLITPLTGISDSQMFCERPLSLKATSERNDNPVSESVYEEIQEVKLREDNAKNENRKSLEEELEAIFQEEDSFSTTSTEEYSWEANNITEIYTDWANHYLEKAKSKKKIVNLQTDVSDGVALAEVIEAVTGQRVADINKKPKTATQMLDNVGCSLSFLVSLGVTTEGITAKDIKDGNLKAILSLFFALSRYKQQQKQALQERKELEKLREKRLESEMVVATPSAINRFVPGIKGQNGVGSAIPTPALGGRRSALEHHVRVVRSSTPSGTPGSQLKSNVASANSSRSTSPANGAASFIPTPRSGHGVRGSLSEKHSKSNVPSSVNTRSSLRGPQTTPTHNSSSPYHSQPSSTKHKDSMLDKLKLFKDNKNKTTTSSSGVSKRTSSSSGFSSARSERSDSSTSLCSEARPPPLPPHQNLPVSTTSSSSGSEPPNAHNDSRSQGLRGIRSRFSRSGGKESSPKSSRKEERESRGSPKTAHKGYKIPSDHRDTRDTSNESRKTEKLTLELETGVYQPQKLNGPLEPEQRQTKVAVASPRVNHEPLRPLSPIANGEIPQQAPPLLLSSTPSSPLAPHGTSIPKPTALVKGTAKMTPTEKVTTSVTPNINSPVASREYHKELNIPPSPSKLKNTEQQSPESNRDPKNSLPRQKQLGRSDESSSNLNVALVSPMPSSAREAPCNELNSVESSQTNGGISNSSENTADFENEDELKITVSKSEECLIEEEGDELIMNIKPMQPLFRPTQYGILRGLGNHRIVPPSLHISRLALQDNAHTVPQKGMRIAPHHLKRPVAGLAHIPSGHILDSSEYSDFEAIELANGYLSDGDVLRGVAIKAGANPDLDGYMSEGGASLYAHRLNQRFQEGMRQVHENMSKVQHFMHDDRNNNVSLENLMKSDCRQNLTISRSKEFEENIIEDKNANANSAAAKCLKLNGDKNVKKCFDDSSSLSSGVSDTLNEMSAEDILSSSLSSDHPAYSKVRDMRDPGMKLGVGMGSSSPRRVPMGVDPSSAYKVVSSKAHVKKTESAQQTENSAFKQISNTQWKKYVENGKGTLDYPAREYQQMSSRTQKKLNSPSLPNSPILSNSGTVSPVSASGRKQERKMMEKAKDFKVIQAVSPQVNGDLKKLQNPKTAPNIFSYNSKRTTSSSSVSSTGSYKAVGRTKHEGENGRKECSSQSLERPRTKLKVSGGTQTTNDLQYINSGAVHSDGEYSSSSLGRKYQIKSHSLNGPTAAQLSQSVRERILQSSLNKTHIGEISPFTSQYYRDRSPRLKTTDGSLSDSPYSNYSELQYSGNSLNNSFMWMNRNNCQTNISSVPTRPLGGSLAEAESLESILSSAANISAQIQHARTTSLTQTHHLIQPREASGSPVLARSSSVRSTKSEKLFGAAIPSRELFHSSQPTSPTPLSNRGATMSPLNTQRGSIYYSTVIPRTSIKDEDCHGSSLSLVSSSSSLYSCQDEKQNSEIRKLRKELMEAQERVASLSNQLTTNAHVVAAFEQSLTNMTNRLQQLTATSEQKESELIELRRIIEALRLQSVNAGLTVASLQSTSYDSPIMTSSPLHQIPNSSCGSLNVTRCANRCDSPEKSYDLARRHTFTGACRDLVACEISSTDGGNLVRGTSVESVSSLSSACSAASHTSINERSDSSKSGKKKGWLRSSFTKAFSRGHKKSKQGLAAGSTSDVDDYRGECSVPSSPLPNRSSCSRSEEDQRRAEEDALRELERLRCQLREKDMALTDSRLEALTSAHQLESLKETLNKMRSEMISLRQDNDRLQRLMSSKSMSTSQSSLPMSDTIEQGKITDDDLNPLPDSADVLLIDPCDKDGKRVTITVFMGCHGEYEKHVNPCDGSFPSECVIGAISISGKTKWDILDSLVRRIFKEYLLRVDPVSSLGMNPDSILTYHLGEVSREFNAEYPELLPCGYLIGDVKNVQITLKGACLGVIDGLAFETLIPKSIVHRYVSLLTEHKRIILCGPSGTGKTFLAQKLAEYLVYRLAKEPSSGNIATFSVDHKTGKDLGAYLSHVSDLCEREPCELPTVIILDNLHYAGALSEVFNGFLSSKHIQCPYIIGTMNQTTSCSTTNLQLHHNFRWILVANHMEPVKGLVSRVSRRRLTQVEVESGCRQPKLQQVLDWLPRCWAHINKFLETHSSSDVTIGPRLFLSCPGTVEGSQVWFTDLWNYSLMPYIVEVVREGLQLYGKRASWEDPTTWIIDTYPWPSSSHPGSNALLSLRPEDVGYDSIVSNANAGTQEKLKGEGKVDTDPLLSMLMKLQEVANYPASPEASMSLENMDKALESTI